MSTSFEKYNDILLDALASNPRLNEISLKKKEILDELFDYFGIDSDPVLFVGFSPGLLHFKNAEIYVTEVSDSVLDFFKQKNVDVKYIDKAAIKSKQFAVTIAVDEYFTFAESDSDQREKVNFLCNITSKFIVTTLKDYKNQDFKDREFSQPILLRENDTKKIYFEHYDYDQVDRNSCLGTCYIVNDDSLDVIGPFSRRNMFFKQLAKFSLDAGADSFLVHKNLMHKSIIKKNYEHIITIKF